MMTRAQKDTVIASLREKIEKANGLFLTNMIGVSANDSVALRKKVRESNGTIVVTKNTLFGKAAEGTYAQELLGNLKGTNAIAFAFEDAPGVAKAIFETSKELEHVKIGDGFLKQKPLPASEVEALAKLPSRNEMLGTLLATFMAPISAFARLTNSIKDECEKQGVSKPSELKVEKAEETAE